MDTITSLITHRPLIALHLGAALLALVVGIVVMLRRKGTVDHKRLGWFWAGLMAVTAVSAMFIRDDRLPNIAGYTPIHLFSLFVGVQLPQAIWRIRRGNVAAHRQTMRGLFWGAAVTAGLFALLPQRFLGKLLWTQVAALIA